MAEGGAKAKDRKGSKITDAPIDELIGNPCFECDELCLDKDKDNLNCNRCKSWFHLKCTSIKTTEWKVLSKNPFIVYVCETCMTQKGKDHSDIQEIKELLKDNLRETKESMKKLETDILQKVDKAIEEKLCKQSETQERLESMINEVKGVEVNIETKIRREVEIFMDKHQEKETRKCNLIIHRLKETCESDKEQKLKDKEDILKIFEITNPEMKAEIQEHLKVEKKIIRLGAFDKNNTKPRSIKIILPDEEAKWDILKGCKNLKDSEYQGISVQADQTKEERDRNQALRQELKERLAGGENVCIYRNQIIPKTQRPNNEKKDQKQQPSNENKE